MLAMFAHFSGLAFVFAFSLSGGLVVVASLLFLHFYCFGNSCHPVNSGCFGQLDQFCPLFYIKFGTILATLTGFMSRPKRKAPLVDRPR